MINTNLFDYNSAQDYINSVYSNEDDPFIKNLTEDDKEDISRAIFEAVHEESSLENPLKRKSIEIETDQNSNNENEELQIKDAANYCGISREQLRNAANGQKIRPKIRSENFMVFNVKDLELFKKEYVQSGRVLRNPLKNSRKSVNDFFEKKQQELKQIIGSSNENLLPEIEGTPLTSKPEIINLTKLLTVKEAADYCNLESEQIRKAAKKEKITPCIREDNRKMHFKPEDVIEFKRKYVQHHRVLNKPKTN